MKVFRATPSLPVNDIPKARAFAQDCLGFEVISEDDRHALCANGPAFIRFINASPDADMDDPARQLVLYMDVDDVDTFHATHKVALEALPPDNFRAPFDQPYAQREMHIIHGPFLFILGHPIEGAT